MGLVVPLLAFGVGLIAFGFYYRLMDYSLDFLDPYIINSEYYVLCQAIFDSMPWIAIIVGVICLILAGVTHKSSSGDASE